MIGVSEFCKQPFMRTESLCTIAPFWGVKSAALMFYSTQRTLPNVLLIPIIRTKMEERCKCFIRSYLMGNFGRKMQVFHSILEPTTF